MCSKRTKKCKGMINTELDRQMWHVIGEREVLRGLQLY